MSIKNIDSVPFQAIWPKSRETSFSQKVAQAAYNVLSVYYYPLGLCRLAGYALHVAAGRSILISQTHDKNDPLLAKGRQILLNKFKGEELSLKTPDNVLIDAMHIPGKQNGQYMDKSGRTLVFFLGNYGRFELMGMSRKEQEIEFDEDNLAQFVDRGYNVMLFNYRGVSRSESYATAEGLVLDGETALQYVKDRLHVPEEEITVAGRSLGGGVSLEVLAMHPHIKYININSFSSLSQQVRVMFKAKPALAETAANALWLLGWEFNSLKNFQKLQGERWVVYHPEDTTITYDASLHKAAGDLEVNQLKLHTHEEVQNYYQNQYPGRNIDALIKQLYGHAHTRKLLPEELDQFL